MTRYFYGYEADNLEEEKNLFLNVLYHDKKNGQAIRLEKNGDRVSQFSTFDLDELAQTGTDRQVHCYTTVNTFRGTKRTAEKVFNYCSIFIDLDCHEENAERIRMAKEITVKILEEAYETGELAVPTLIVDSGRGFGIQYVLACSIANVPGTKGQREFFKKVRSCIFKRYKDILSAIEGTLEVDFAVSDDARVCRIPGTYNANAGKYCHLIHASETYYELSELVKKCRLWTWKDNETFKKDKEEKARKQFEKEREWEKSGRKVISFAEYRLPFLGKRIEKLMLLQDLRQEECTDNCREQILFIAYSCFVQLNKSTAVENLKRLNARFIDPLGQEELDHIVEETNANRCDDYEGFYKLKNQYLIEKLDLTDEEIQRLGLKKGFKREIERENARNEKMKTRKLVIELLSQQVDYLTYDQIAAMTGVSRRTVCTVAKEEGLMRYHKAAEKETEIEACVGAEKAAEIITMSDSKEASLPDTQSAKSAAESVCVPFVSSLLPEGHFSTPSPAGAGFGLFPGEEDASEEFDWYGYLVDQVSASCNEILRYFDWSSSFEPAFAIQVEAFFEDVILKLARNETEEAFVLAELAKMFATQGEEECFAVLQEDIIELPSLLNRFKQREKGQKKKTTSLKQKRQNSIDYENESVQDREKRINWYLKNYKDERFTVIEKTEEYDDLDTSVLREVKVAFMQTKRLMRETLFVEGEPVPVPEIKEYFNQMTYKDVVVVCRRIMKEGTLKQLKNTFFYIVQSVVKFKNEELAKKQAERIKKESENKNTFNNFDQRDYDYDDLEKKLLMLNMS